MTAPGASGPPGRLFAYNGGFLNRRIRRILQLSGHSLHVGVPKSGDGVVIWGASPTSHRGLSMAARHDAPITRVEDAFLRSLHPGRDGEPPLGLLIDGKGVHFDPQTPSDLETLLATHPLDDTALLDRARDAIERIKEAHLTKYAATRTDIEPPAPGYVLVIDQTQGDASVTASEGNAARFREMLVFAQEEHPGAPVVIKTHPETAAGYRPGYFGPDDCNHRISLFTNPISPWKLLDGAVGVHTLSSQMGFEAILAGHKPRVFGQPFYSGWGLTDDDRPVPRRERQLTRAQLFAAAMILYPRWYDPFRDQLCALEDVLNLLEAQATAWRQDRAGWVASEMRLWKRGPMQKVFGREKKVVFADDLEKVDTTERPRMVWAGKARSPDHDGAVRVEDGFLRSRGLGAELVPPLSLVCDPDGIYYDPRGPSALEKLIERRATLRPDQQRRAEALIKALNAKGVSKYNLGGAVPRLGDGHKILVPGQVENDASILTGAGLVRTNLDLLRAARTAHPDAILIYKPHPDVEAGLRPGDIPEDTLTELTDVVARKSDPAALLQQVDALWTMTSLMGFEALLRGVSVTTLGAPFYAGWGLTTDMGPVPERRTARPSLAGLVHAALIDYPRYHDPKTGAPCPVEYAVELLSSGDIPHPGLANRLLSKLQGVFASQAHLWR